MNIKQQVILEFSRSITSLQRDLDFYLSLDGNTHGSLNQFYLEKMIKPTFDLKWKKKKIAFGINKILSPFLFLRKSFKFISFLKRSNLILLTLFDSKEELLLNRESSEIGFFNGNIKTRKNFISNFQFNLKFPLDDNQHDYKRWRLPSLILFFGNQQKISRIKLMNTLIWLKIVSIQSINAEMLPRGIGFEIYLEKYLNLYRSYYQIYEYETLVSKEKWKKK